MSKIEKITKVLETEAKKDENAKKAMVSSEKNLKKLSQVLKKLEKGAKAAEK